MPTTLSDELAQIRSILPPTKPSKPSEPFTITIQANKANKAKKANKLNSNAPLEWQWYALGQGPYTQRPKKHTR